jgi:membrane protease YdiL (CAAX protease family)
MRFNPAPGWPPPPPRWSPPAGWRPDPSWPAAPAGWNFWIEDRTAADQPRTAAAADQWARLNRPTDSPGPPTNQPRPPSNTPSAVRTAPTRRWALDEAVRRNQLAGDVRWPVRLAILPTASIIAVLLLEYLISRNWHPSGAVRITAFGIGSVLHYAVAVAVIIAVGAPVARGCGGWLAAFGWGRPRWQDLLLGLGTAAAEYAVRVVATIVLVIAVPALRGVDAGNISLAGRPRAEVIILFVVAIAVAPPIEELIFRGLLLRTLMRRFGFWPSAAVSSLAFAVLHLYEVNTPAAAVLLFVSILVFGLGQCLLVRWGARLAPAIVAHAVANTVGLILALALTR